MDATFRISPVRDLSRRSATQRNDTRGFEPSWHGSKRHQSAPPCIFSAIR